MKVTAGGYCLFISTGENAFRSSRVTSSELGFGLAFLSHDRRDVSSAAEAEVVGGRVWCVPHSHGEKKKRPNTRDPS